MAPSGATLDQGRSGGGRPAYTAPATLLVPLRPGARRVLWLIMRATSRFRSPNLENLSILHFGEWALCTPRGDTLPDRHLFGSFLFLSDFDGDVDDYIMAFARGPRLVFKLLFWWSAGYPGARNSGALLTYIRRFLHPAGYYYSAYPEATLKDVRSALALASHLDRLTAAVPADFDPLYRALLRDQVQHGAAAAPTPRRRGPVRSPREGLPTATFTCLVPLGPGGAAAVTDELARHQASGPSFFDEVAGTHFARFAVVSRLFDRHNRLLPFDPSYLLFSAQFDRAGPDGGRRDYVERLCRVLITAHPDLARMWAHGDGCPAIAPDTASELARYLFAHRVTPGLFVTGTPVPPGGPPASVARIRSALRWAAVFERFVADAGPWSADERHDEFHRRFHERHCHADTGGGSC